MDGHQESIGEAQTDEGSTTVFSLGLYGMVGLPFSAKFWKHLHTLCTHRVVFPRWF